MVQHKYAEHICDLALDDDGLTKLPPNAPFCMRFIRQLRRFLSPNPNAAISKRNYRNRSQICAERRRHARSRYFYIIHPYSDMQMLRDLIFIIIGTFEIITAPLNISFGLIFNDKRYENFFKYAGIVMFGLEIFWCITCFFSGYRVNMPKSIEINHWKIVKRYLRTYFIIDICLTMWIPNLDSQTNLLIYWINMAVFFRASTLCVAFKRFFQDFGFSDQVIQFIFLILISVYMVHIFTCIFYLLPFLAYHKHEFGTQMVWIDKAGLVNNDSNSIIYISCLVLIKSYMWGLGEPLSRPENPIDLAVIIVAMIFGRIWSLFVIAIVLRILTIRSMSESKYEEYLSQMETFMKQRNIPAEFRTMLFEYYRYKYQYHYFNEKAIFNALSQYLRQELQLFVARGLMSKVAIFKQLPKSTVSAIISKSKQMVYTTNKALVVINDPIDNILFINYGTVAVLNSTDVEITHLKDGDDIGLEGLLSKTEITHLYTYVATETTEVYVISIKEFRNLVPANVDMKIFTKKVDQRREEFNKIEELASTQAVDLISELKSGMILERPRIRTRYFEN